MNDSMSEGPRINREASEAPRARRHFDVRATVEALRDHPKSRVLVREDVFHGLGEQDREELLRALQGEGMYDAIVHNAALFDVDISGALREAVRDDWRFVTHVGPHFIPPQYHRMILREAIQFVPRDRVLDFVGHTEYMSGLQDADFAWLAEWLIDRSPEEARVLVYRFPAFHRHGLDAAVWVWRCIDATGNGAFVFAHLQNFPGAATLEFALQCIERDDLYELVVRYIHQFDVSLHKEIFHALVAPREGRQPMGVVDVLRDNFGNPRLPGRSEEHGFRGLGMGELEALDGMPYAVDREIDDATRSKALFQRFLTFRSFFGDVSDQEAFDFFLARGCEKSILREFEKLAGPFNRETSLWFLHRASESHIIRWVVEGVRDGRFDITFRDVLDAWIDAPRGYPQLFEIAHRLVWFEGVVGDEDLRKLSRGGFGLEVGSFVANQLEREAVEMVDSKALLERLLDVGASRYVGFTLDRHAFDVSEATLAEHLANDGEVHSLLQYKHAFLPTPARRVDLFNRAVSAGYGVEVLPLLDTLFPSGTEREGFDMNALVRGCLAADDARVAWAERRGERVPMQHESEFFKHRQMFLHTVVASQPHEDVALSLIEHGYHRIAMQWYAASGMPINPEVGTRILDALFEHEAYESIASYIGLFQSFVDVNKVARRLIDEAVGSGHFLKHLGAWSGLDDETARIMLDAWSGFDLTMAEHPRAFHDLSDDVVLRVCRCAMSAHKVGAAYEFSRAFGTPDVVLDRLYSAFGVLFSPEIYDVAWRIMRDEQPDGARYRYETGIKITLGGLRGVNQLIMGLRAARNTIVHGTLAKRDVRTPLQVRWFGDVTRYFTSEFSDGDFGVLDDTVRGYLDHEELYVALPPEYADTDIMHVERLDDRSARSFAYSEGFLDRFKELDASMRQGAARVIEEQLLKIGDRSGFGLSIIVNTLRRVADDVLHRLRDEERAAVERARDEGKDVERVRAAHALAREGLERIDFRRISHPQEMFLVLRRYREFDAPLRELMFYFMFRQHPNMIDSSQWEWDFAHPQRGDISRMMNLVQHLTYHETIAPMVTDGDALSEVAELLNVSALTKEFERFQQYVKGTGGTMPMQIRFQRNVLTEMSGFIGDACWAPHDMQEELGEKDVLGNFPHIVSYTFIGNPGHPRFERFVGAGLLIHARNTAGEEVMVIRGNNPIENFITKVDAYDVLYRLVEQVESVATKRGARLAMVIDHQGGAGTNRAAMQGVYEELLARCRSRVVDLADDPPTTFNGYNLGEITYYVSLEDVRYVLRVHRGEIAWGDEEDHG